ncbi:hypothetical protein HOA55_00940 [archaeon]|jgi:hypothetical protein|nr:hypothetical protein [archaeon]MBT3577633.1 hypothetical protein [archaeon]MBT6819901.1 hypothetical protein [archaeon]MBT6956689.1 hypothetical protein [archaeon]MBT7025057.1 hypothetical protein [archaeon]
MYKGFGAEVAITIFDQSRANDSNRMLGNIRRSYPSYGLPAIRYIGKDAPEWIEDIGVFINGVFYSGDQVRDISDKLNELEKAAAIESGEVVEDKSLNRRIVDYLWKILTFQ